MMKKQGKAVLDEMQNTTLILRAGIYMLVVYALCFASMEIMRRIYRKRLDLLENAD